MTRCCLTQALYLCSPFAPRLTRWLIWLSGPSEHLDNPLCLTTRQRRVQCLVASIHVKRLARLGARATQPAFHANLARALMTKQPRKLVPVLQRASSLSSNPHIFSQGTSTAPLLSCSVLTKCSWNVFCCRKRPLYFFKTSKKSRKTLHLSCLPVVSFVSFH